MIEPHKETTVPSKAMRRAIRSARAVLHGPKILEQIQQPKVRRLLTAAAHSGVPPVTAISEKLLEILPRKDAKLTPVKQFTGLCVRAVLEEEGFEVAETGVRVSNDPVFRTGATYRPTSGDEQAALGLLARIIDHLTDEEAELALTLLRKRQRR
jgi:hypothetical protein